MNKHNGDNERIKRKYLRFLKESKGLDESSIDAVAKAISRFSDYTNQRDFKRFHIEQAIGFKKHLGAQKNKQTGKPLSKATLHSTVMQLKGFFQWLAMQPGYRVSVNYNDAEYFNLTEKDTRVATTRRHREAPTLEQVNHVIKQMPCATPIENRDRAVVAFILLTGARDSAVASLKLKHIDIDKERVDQDNREVKTKFSKSFETFFFPVGKEITEIVTEWVSYLKNELLWGLDDPLFPKTAVSINEDQQFEASGLLRENWSNAAPIRKIFKQAFEHAGLPYFIPHSIRNTIIALGEKICNTPEEFKVWSQNIGHDSVLTSLTSYGEVGKHRQAEIMKQLAQPKDLEQSKEDKIAEAVIRKLRESNDIS